MDLSEADKALLTPDQIAQLTSDRAEALLAIEPGGRVEPQTEPKTEPQSTKPSDESVASTADKREEEGDETQADDANPDAGGTGEADPAALQAIIAEAEAEPAKPVVYTVDATDYEAQLKDIKAKVAEANKKWRDSEIDDEAYHAQLEELGDQRDAVVAAKGKADAIKQINADNAAAAAARRAQEETEACAAVIQQAAKDKTIDYVKDLDAQREFDAVFNAYLALPRHAGKPALDVARLAHRSVLLARGIDAPAPASAPAPAPAAAPAPAMRNVPRTLSGLPDAGHLPVQDEQMAVVHGLEGEDLARWMARQPQHVIDDLLRKADKTALRGRV